MITLTLFTTVVSVSFLLFPTADANFKFRIQPQWYFFRRHQQRKQRQTEKCLHNVNEMNNNNAIALRCVLQTENRRTTGKKKIWLKNMLSVLNDHHDYNFDKETINCATYMKSSKDSDCHFLVKNKNDNNYRKNKNDHYYQFIKETDNDNVSYCMMQFKPNQTLPSPLISTTFPETTLVQNRIRLRDCCSNNNPCTLRNVTKENEHHQPRNLQNAKKNIHDKSQIPCDYHYYDDKQMILLQREKRCRQWKTNRLSLPLQKRVIINLIFPKHKLISLLSSLSESIMRRRCYVNQHQRKHYYSGGIGSHIRRRTACKNIDKITSISGGDSGNSGINSPASYYYHSTNKRDDVNNPYVERARSTTIPSHFHRATTSTSASSSRYRSTDSMKNSGYRGNQQHHWYHSIQDWYIQNIQGTVKTFPKIQCRLEPTTTLKIRKTFYPLKTIIRLCADFNTQLGVWQFQSSWEDSIIGGKLTISGRREIQFQKSWQVSVLGTNKGSGGSTGGKSTVGGIDSSSSSYTYDNEDLVTRIRFRAAVDLQTWKAYVRFGVRTERLSSYFTTAFRREGFTLKHTIPLDGSTGHVRLEVKTNFILPEPEIEYSTESQRSLIGMGDIEVGIEELNLLLDY